MKSSHFVAIGLTFVGVLFVLLIFNAPPPRQPTAAEIALAKKASSEQAAHGVAEKELTAAADNLDQYSLPLPGDWASTSGVTKPAYARGRVAAFVRWEKAELGADGPDWKVKVTEEIRAKRTQDAKAEMEATREAIGRMSVGDLMRAGLPITQSEVQEARPGTSPIVVPSSADVSPFSKAMNVRYQASDDENFDEAALNQKLHTAAQIVDQGEAKDEWSEYLRCELSYDAHGGYPTKRPIAKPCEWFVDKIIAEPR